MAWHYWIIVIAIVIFVIAVFAVFADKAKRKRLFEIYKDLVLVEKLMEGTYWVGQTKRELIDSLGIPKDISEKVLKTKTKEIYKYYKTGNNRYDLKITLENNVVIGWDKK